jgi:outer membrane protein OmpA-like peptidoglycan-associated protein
MKKVNTSILFLVITFAIALLGAVSSTGVSAGDQELANKKVRGQWRRDDPAQSQQKKLKDQIAHGVSIDSYPVALAQAWIDYGRESFARKDRRASGEALREAQSVIDAIEREGQDTKVNARLIPSAKKLRDDLWQQASMFKLDAEFRCATWQTARMEIALVAAGRADQDMGWRAARPLVSRAERFARDAKARMKACAEPKPAAKVIEPDDKQAVPEKKSIEDIKTPAPSMGKTIEATPVQSLPDRVHFVRESAELGDVSALVLEQVSFVMRANPSIVLDLVGYADELSSVEENNKLALSRAQAVQEYLIETGVGRERLIVREGEFASGSGKSSLERAKVRRVEFVPTQSETIPMDYQDKDLSMEGPQG